MDLKHVALSGWSGFRRRAPWYLMLTLAFSVPLSVKLYSVNADLEVITPSEPIAGLLAIWLLLSCFRKGLFAMIDRSLLAHPITLLFLADLGVGLLSFPFSGDPMVSLKWIIVRSVYVVVFFFGALYVASNGRGRIEHLLLAYAGGALFVVAWTFRRGVQLGFERTVSNWSCIPFYNDHTMYAAALVFMLFTFAIFAWQGQRLGAHRAALAYLLLTLVTFLALFATYGRGAWLSLVVALGVGGVILLRPKPVHWISGVLALGIAGYVLWQPLQQRSIAHKGDADADDAGLSEILWSYLNVSTDASNRERLVRWRTALSIFWEAPLLGCGPGMYKFAYAEHHDPRDAVYATGPAKKESITAFWAPTEDLIVRQNPQVMYVDPGTAHSEYLLALSERGIGALSVLLAMFAVVLHRTVRRCTSPFKQGSQLEFLLVALALVAYGIHGVFNNFLDDCKIAFPFFAFLALFVHLDGRGGPLEQEELRPQAD